MQAWWRKTSSRWSFIWLTTGHFLYALSWLLVQCNSKPRTILFRNIDISFYKYLPWPLLLRHKDSNIFMFYRYSALGQLDVKCQTYLLVTFEATVSIGFISEFCSVCNGDFSRTCLQDSSLLLTIWQLVVESFLTRLEKIRERQLLGIEMDPTCKIWLTQSSSTRYWWRINSAENVTLWRDTDAD